MNNIATWQVGPGRLAININKETIIELMRQKPEATVKRIAEYMNMSESGVRYHINKMRQEGLIEYVGATKNGRWKIND